MLRIGLVDIMAGKTISMTVSIELFKELELYAKAKGHGTQYPVSAFLHYAAVQYMKKYPLTDQERTGPLY